MAASAQVKPPRVTVENNNVPGSTSQVDGIKYEATRRALLKALPAKKPGLTQAEVLQAVPAHLPDEEFPGAPGRAGGSSACSLTARPRASLNAIAQPSHCVGIA